MSFEELDKLLSSAEDAIISLAVRDGWLGHYLRVARGKTITVDSDQAYWRKMARYGVEDMRVELGYVAGELDFAQLPSMLQAVENELISNLRDYDKDSVARLADLYSRRCGGVLEEIPNALRCDDISTALGAAVTDGAIKEEERMALVALVQKIRIGLGTIKDGMEGIFAMWSEEDEEQEQEDLPPMFEREEIVKIFGKMPEIRRDRKLYTWKDDLRWFALFAMMVSDKLRMKDGRGGYRWKDWGKAFQLSNIDSLKNTARALRDEGSTEKDKKIKIFRNIINS